MKFKVGDKVRVISFQKVMSTCRCVGTSFNNTKVKLYLPIAPLNEDDGTKLRTDMNLGEIVTISHIYENKSYFIEENTFFYKDWMLEKITRSLDIE